MYGVCDSQALLKCKTNRWGLVYLTWNTMIYQYNNFGLYDNQTEFTLMRALYTNHFTAVP